MILSGRGSKIYFEAGRVSAALLLSGCDWAVLNPKGPIGDGNATLLVDLVAIMLVIVVPTLIIATLGVAWWFRSSNHRAFDLPGLRIFRPAGIDRLAISAAHHHAARRGDLGSAAHPLDPAKPLVFEKKSRSTFRSCRSTGNGC